MSLSIDGTSLIFDGTVTITNATDPTTGVATLVLTPTGGVGTLPALVNGQPGLPALISIGTVSTLSPGASVTASLTQTSAGGPGLNSTYTLNVGIPQGATGSAGSFSLAGASDVSGTAATNNVLAVTGTGPTAFAYKAFPFSAPYQTSILGISTSGQVSSTLCSIYVSARSYDWYPLVLGTASVTGTANTTININALLNSATTGDIVGTSYGVPAAVKQSIVMASGFGPLSSGGGTYGRVSAGAAATIYIVATQTASTSDAWSISSACNYTAIPIPVSFS